jgi:hypothetical protein
MIQTINPQAGFTVKPDTLVPNEAAWNPPKAPSTGCRNTGIHHVGLHASNPQRRRNSTGMFSAWRLSAAAPSTIRSARPRF